MYSYMQIKYPLTLLETDFNFRIEFSIEKSDSDEISLGVTKRNTPPPAPNSMDQGISGKIPSYKIRKRRITPEGKLKAKVREKDFSKLTLLLSVHLCP